MPKLVYLLNVQEAHKEYHSLTGQIRDKYKQLDSGEYRQLMLKPVNWQIYSLMWANFTRNWTYHLQRNYTGPHSSSIEDTFQVKIIGRQFG